MKAVAALLCAISAWAATDDDPLEVLVRVRDRVLAHAERVPNHTCVETIVRDHYARSAAPPPRSCDALLGRRKEAGPDALVTLDTTDRLRLDVAVSMSDGREIYSWAGAGKFEDKEIDEIVPAGAIGTGAFATSLLGIFHAHDPRFTFEGETTLNSRRMMEFSFRIPQDDSHYKVRAGKAWMTTGYTGTLLVDPVTADLRRITLRTEELEPVTDACEVDTTLDYSMVQLGAEEYLLPQMTRERFIGQDGSEAENALTFSACREFRGESSVSFGGTPEPAAVSTSASRPVRPFPGGLPLVIDMISHLNEESAAGDIVEGLVAQPLTDSQGRVLAPFGAQVQGRLMRVEARHGTPGTTTIVLRWETIETADGKLPLALKPDRRSDRGLREGHVLQRKQQEFVLPRVGEEKYASFQFSGEHVVVRDPLRTAWLTVSQ